VEEDPQPTRGERAAQELADKHAPVFMLKTQDEPCDTYGEPYIPMSVDTVLGNEQIALRQAGNGEPLVKLGPTAADLFDRGGGFYLDFPGPALQPGCLYEKDFHRYFDGRNASVYAHIATQADEPDLLAVQYWIYWYFNDWNNKHESDWEFIQVVFEARSVEEALTEDPIEVGYAQHEGGERASWTSDKLEREGDHPVVYSSRGSHASYYGSALFLGRSASEGFGCDNTDGPSTRIAAEAILLPDQVTERDDEFAWLRFEGRWGERHDGPFNGPNGPYQKPRWTEPFEWQDGLRSSSVVVPTGDAQAHQLVGAFCNVVAYGSNQLIELQTSPTKLVLTLTALVALVVFLVNRTRWDHVEPLPIVQRRRSGQIARAACTLYGRHPAAFVMLGLLYLPLAALAGLVVAIVHALPFAGDLLSLFEDGGEATRLALSLLVGGFTGLLAFVVVTAAVATVVEDLSEGTTPSVTLAFRQVLGRLTELASGLARGLVIVLVLDLTVVGIPFGIRQLVRYQLLAPVAMIEDLGGRAALTRSSELVRGRWWNTAIMVSAIHGLLAISGFVLGLVLLVLFTSVPLWMLSIFVTLVSALLMPLGAIALTLLYGDARAEWDERQLAGENTTGMDSGPEMKLDAR
jgi:hypothetical protein